MFASSPDLKGPRGFPVWSMNCSIDSVNKIILFSFCFLFESGELFSSSESALSESSKVFTNFSKVSLSKSSMFS